MSSRVSRGTKQCLRYSARTWPIFRWALICFVLLPIIQAHPALEIGVPNVENRAPFRLIVHRIRLRPVYHCSSMFFSARSDA